MSSNEPTNGSSPAPSASSTTSTDPSISSPKKARGCYDLSTMPRGGSFTPSTINSPAETTDTTLSKKTFSIPGTDMGEGLYPTGASSGMRTGLHIRFDTETGRVEPSSSAGTARIRLSEAKSKVDAAKEALTKARREEGAKESTYRPLSDKKKDAQNALSSLQESLIRRS